MRNCYEILHEKILKYLIYKGKYGIVLELLRIDGPLLQKALRTSGEKEKDMNEIIRSIEAEQLRTDVAEFAVGDTVKVYGKIKEGNRERVQVFECIVLKRQGGSNRETFTVRKMSNGVGVEKTWPLHSPNVEKIEVVRRGKVRRAKLNYLRGRVGKRAKVKELVR